MKATKFFAMGGMQEIGKSMLVVEHEDELVIIDCGVKFAQDTTPGVDVIIPDYTYLKDNLHKIKGLFITHGHLDHCGAVPHLLKQIDLKKIWAPKLGIQYIKNLNKEHKVGQNLEMIEIEKDMVVEFDNIKVDFWTAQHSIPDAFGIRVRTPDGAIVDTGDFRIDYTPIGNYTDFPKLEQIGKDGVDIFISDSTNAMRPNHSPSEKGILKDIEKFIVGAKKKVIIAAFASNLTRVQAIIELAEKHNKKVCTFGRSMVNGVGIAQMLNYINVKKTTIIDKKNLSKYDDNEILILTTGSQGEELAALNRMSIDKHIQVTIRPGDTIIFSSSPIPGNKIKIEQLINRLYKKGALIKEHGVDGIFHTSGHAYKDEHLKVFSIVKPKYFIPYHGTYRMSRIHCVTAVESGVKPENSFVVDNGDVVYLKDHKVWLSEEKVDVGPVVIDGNRVSKYNNEVIDQRLKMSIGGFANVVIALDKNRNSIIGRPRIVSRGTLYVRNSLDVIQEAQRIVHGAVLYTIKNKKDWTIDDIKKIVIDRLGPYFYKTKRRKPIILPVVLIVERKKQIEHSNKNNSSQNKRVEKKVIPAQA